MHSYSENNASLNATFNAMNPIINIEDSEIEIRNCSFQSHFKFSDPLKEEVKDLSEMVMPHNMERNDKFSYPLFVSTHQKKANKVILLFHGLNERSWGKYLSWAKYLAENTGQAVLLFPIAFHMNRSPVDWSNPGYLLNYMRKSTDFESEKSNFANVAMSERLMKNPKQFFISGAQTMQDVVDLMDEVKVGAHPYLEKNTTFNLFGYSIGAFLAQILLIANPKNYFKNSRLLLFCGGPTFDQMNGISKYIMNKDAFEALRKLFLSSRKSDIKKRLYVKRLLNVKDQYEAFLAMVRLDNSPKRRERRFRQFSKQIYAICLLKDVVMPAVSIMNTLSGRHRNIQIPIDMMDFNYQYSHENPFPIFKDGKQKLVDAGFEVIFSKAAGFYNS